MVLRTHRKAASASYQELSESISRFASIRPMRSRNSARSRPDSVMVRALLREDSDPGGSLPDRDLDGATHYVVGEKSRMI